MLDTNLTGALNVASAASEHLGPGSAIVNIGAVVGFRGFPGDAAYASSKAGLAGLTRALAIELARRDITVNLVIPGLVLTEMTEGLSPRALEAMRRSDTTFAYWYPVMKDVRRHPGFKDLVRDMNLVEYWREYGWADSCRPVGEEDFECE